MNVIIFTGGNLRPGQAVSYAIEKANRILAADCGAKTALSFNCLPECILGDFDSLDKQTLQKLKEKECKFIRFPAEKDETDTELAIKYAIEQKATEISILGGIEGNRIDHILANLFIISNRNIPITYINGSTKVWITRGPKKVRIYGKSSDVLSLVPLSENVSGITTKNLTYALHNETLSFEKSRGISNIFMEPTVEVSFEKGLLLFTQVGQEDLKE